MCVPIIEVPKPASPGFATSRRLPAMWPRRAATTGSAEPATTAGIADTKSSARKA